MRSPHSLPALWKTLPRLAIAVLAILTILARASPPELRAAPDDPPNSGSPVAVFSSLDGTWEGTFVGYDATGKELYRIAVRQTYRTVSETVQEVEIRDRMPDGVVTTGKGRNVATRNESGELELLCEVEKSNGDLVRHRGRLVRGPEGEEQIVWFTAEEGRVETFREVVRMEGEERVYRIEGMGRYGGDGGNGTMVLMTGRYVRKGEGEGERKGR